MTASASDSSVERPVWGEPLPRGFAAVAILTALALAAALTAKLPALTAPLCWRWPYRDLDLGAAVVPLLPGLAIWLGGLALLGGPPTRRRILAAVALFSLATLALELGSLWLDPHGAATLELRVESRFVTSYFTDAAERPSARELLRDFPPRGLHAHSRTHPPGPILYYWLLIRAVGPHAAAVTGGLLIGLLAAGVVPLLYRFAANWSQEPRERATVAALWPLLPALVGFFPEFDQVYPLFTIGVWILWRRALGGGRRAAFLAGALATLGLFLAWNLLLLAVVAGALTVRFLAAAPREAARWRAVARAFGFVALGAGAVALVPSLLYSYHPAHALRAALAAQARMGLDASCPWRRAVLAGPWDLALGLGGLPFVLWSGALVRAFARRGSRAASSTLVGAATLVVVDLSGLLPQETARVWLFLVPLLLAPAGVELARLPPRWRAAAFTAQVVVFVVALARLVFISL